MKMPKSFNSARARICIASVPRLIQEGKIKFAILAVIAAVKYIVS